MAEPGSRYPKKPPPKCLDVISWRSPTKEELIAFMNDSRANLAAGRRRTRRSVLAVRNHLSPVDVYCYLKGRFGEPNGFANFLRHDHSDNLIHWDFNLKADDEDVYI